MLSLERILSPIVGWRFRRRSDCRSDVELSWPARASAPRRDQIQIGDHCSICGTFACDEAGQIVVGPYTTVRYRTIIGSAASITIGSHCIISNNVTIYDHNSHPTDPDIRYQMCESGFYSDLWTWKHAEKQPIIIEDNVWIGQHALICKGVTIGHGSIVAANAVVTKNVPPLSIVAGNPAKVVKALTATRERATAR